MSFRDSFHLKVMTSWFTQYVSDREVCKEIPYHTAAIRYQISIKITVSKIKDKMLTHWGRGMHICVSNLTIIGSDNGLSPGRRQAITWTHDGIFLLIRSLATNFSEILIEIHIFHSRKCIWKWWPVCLGLEIWQHPSRHKASLSIQ